MASDDFVLNHWRNDIALVKVRDTVSVGSEVFPQIQSLKLPERWDTAFHTARSAAAALPKVRTTYRTFCE